MQTNIKKWGNGLRIQIPDDLAEHLKLPKGSVMKLIVENGQIVIKTPKYNLDAMLKKINSKNLHSESFQEEQEM